MTFIHTLKVVTPEINYYLLNVIIFLYIFIASAILRRFSQYFFFVFVEVHYKLGCSHLRVRLVKRRIFCGVQPHSLCLYECMRNEVGGARQRRDEGQPRASGAGHSSPPCEVPLQTCHPHNVFFVEMPAADTDPSGPAFKVAILTRSLKGNARFRRIMSLIAKFYIRYYFSILQSGLWSRGCKNNVIYKSMV